MPAPHSVMGAARGKTLIESSGSELALLGSAGVDAVLLQVAATPCCYIIPLHDTSDHTVKPTFVVSLTAGVP